MLFPNQLIANEPEEQIDLAPNSHSAILMDADTGTIIFEKNAHDRLPPASITKVMTMLLIMEALDSGKIQKDEMVRTSELAASMGGSQIFLEVGEEMSVEDMLKGIAMASGNDASVAMAEKIAGSEEMFVQMMNDRAKQLGLENTNFVNSNGLPAAEHYSSAHDIAIMSKELLKHEEITQFTSKYQDYLRKDTDDPFWLVNTNKLVRFYQGADGLKTGYTSEAKYCLTATAKRNDMRVIAVVLGEPTTKSRNYEVSKLFDYAFSQYTNFPIFKPGEMIGSIPIEKGDVRNIDIVAKQQYSVLMKKGESKENIRHEIELEPELKAPVDLGQIVGKLTIYQNENKIKEIDLDSPMEVREASYWEILKRTVEKVLFVQKKEEQPENQPDNMNNENNQEDNSENKNENIEENNKE
ncbi:D-alanyl-D-alanine carboxypeptidase family protein [Chengkuizengella sp. 2205SS18-9]|uniref:serine-type D-Ala-D-Ala carboxypeptidase n=2 Tax=Chengkuizengella axinellae TaxID=3064388 RepID=A0ABT9IWV5_9BACL|nr:D-alanyl-D-alanine carboxypeptidase family protein [Chengkuizengella sp. 2205SS18-9]MDP5273733.1 D-alanyl-D-alanine carboxypeptidase family protein [Chengkuizengella sp. 2205SS18-9]